MDSSEPMNKAKTIQDAMLEAADGAGLSLIDRATLRIAMRHEEFYQEAVDALVAEGKLPEGSTIRDAVGNPAQWLAIIQILIELYPLLLQLFRKGAIRLRRE